MEPVTANFLVTKEDFFQFKQASCKAELRRGEVIGFRLTGLAVAIGGLAGMIFVPWGIFAKIGFGLMLAVSIVIGFYHDTLYPYLIHRRISSLLESTRMTAQTLRFEEDAVQVSSERYEAELPYPMLYRIYEDRYVFLLYLGIGELHFVPKRVLSEEEQRRLQQHFKRVMNEKYMQEGVR